MRCTSSERAAGRRARRLAVALAVAWPLGACTYVAAPPFPRPALALPPLIAQRYALPAAPQLLRQQLDAEHDITHGQLLCGDETVRFHVHRGGVAGRPLVLLVPILAGGEDLMRALATRLVNRGFDAAWCERAGPALSPPQRGADLERLFRRTVLHQRALLQWLRTCDQPPPSTFALGVSLGGMVATVLAAVEPGLDGVGICLAGGDLPQILLDSAEGRVVRWREWRRDRDGLAGTPLAQEIAAHLDSDPARLAAYVATRDVLFVSASLDEVVRPRHQDLLWEALGRPARFTVPLGHYSAALAIDAIVDSVAGFFRDRLAETASRPAAAPLATGS